jgi:hypothetical protein
MSKSDGGIGGSPPTPGDKRDLPVSLPQPRTPEQVINAAIVENKKWEWMCYFMAIGFGMTGLGAIWFGVWYNHQWATIGGSMSGLTFAWVLHKSIETWRANLTLRMLELSLNDSKELRATLAALREVYLSHYKKHSKKEGGI